MGEYFKDEDYWARSAKGHYYGHPRQCRAYRTRPIPEDFDIPSGAEVRRELDGTRRIRCGKISVIGRHHCPTHGESAPQNKAKAQEMLQLLIDPAIRALDEVLMGPTAEWVCVEEGEPAGEKHAGRPGVWKLVGYSMTDKLRAVREILERVDLTDDVKAPYMAIHDELMRRAAAESEGSSPPQEPTDDE